MGSSDIDVLWFHDNLIRGITFSSEVGSFSSDVSFDIEHILEWMACSPAENHFLFSVSQAIMTFHDVSDLNINVCREDSKYTRYSAGSFGFYIMSITKRKVDSKLGKSDYYGWKITTNNKDQLISFGASGISLKLIGEPKLVNRQHLLNSERAFLS